MTKTVVLYNNIIKVSLKNLPKETFDLMNEKFKTFNSLLDGNTVLYLKINNYIDKHNIDLKYLKNHIIAFCAVTQDYLYNVLENIEVLEEFRNRTLSKQLLDLVVYDCKKEQKNLCLTKLSKNGQNYLINNLELLSSKYSINIYSLEEILEDY